MRENWHLPFLNISKIHQLKTTILSFQVSKRHEFQKKNSLIKAKLGGEPTKRTKARENQEKYENEHKQRRTSFAPKSYGSRFGFNKLPSGSLKVLYKPR